MALVTAWLIRMYYRRRLRSRIILAFLIFGIALTASFAGITLLMREWLEEELIESTLQREVDRAVEASRKAGQAAFVEPFSGITGTIKGANRFSEIPFNRRLDTGVYDIREPSPKTGEMRSFKLAVRKTDDRWAYLEYDVTNARQTRQILVLMLVGLIAIFSALSLCVAFWLSRRVLRPVTDLVHRVQKLKLSQQAPPLAHHFADDEVGQLAAALDDYSQRLNELATRDQEFNANVSHELRTPLAIIRGAAELLLAQEGLPEKTQERIRRIDRAARQSSELTNALLLLSRNERRVVTPEEPTIVTSVVEQVIDTHRFQLGNKPIEVKVEVNANPMVAAPPEVLAVALGNLIGNAFKYTKQGLVLIRVNQHEVQIEDTGPGVDAQEVTRLFERGYRSDKAGGSGAGLGLAIVQRLCHLYGWHALLAPGKNGGTFAQLSFGTENQSKHI
jgi:signal transduction histidine kinase